MGIADEATAIVETGNLAGRTVDEGRPRAVAVHRGDTFGAVLFVVDRSHPRALVVTVTRSGGVGWQDEGEFGFGWYDNPFEAPSRAELGGLGDVAGWASQESAGAGLRIVAGRAAAEVTRVLLEFHHRTQDVVLGTGGSVIAAWSATGPLPLAIRFEGAGAVERLPIPPQLKTA